MDDHVRMNRAFWDSTSAEYQHDHSFALVSEPVAWGTWRIPESALAALGDLEGRRVLEYGCGGGQFGIGLARLGVAIVGLDVSEAQLEHARELANEHHIRLPLLQADGERLPFHSGAFDVVFCDHGAMSFCDPDTSLAEVARVLRSRGRLAFCTSSRLRFVCMDDAWQLTTSLQRSWFGQRRLDDGNSVDFSLTPGGWIAAARRHDFTVEALHELRPAAEATTTFEWYSSLDWASRWPAEELWVLVKN